MKESKPMLFSKKDLAKIIIPLIFQNILTVTIGMADSMMVSRKSDVAFAGVSLVSSLDTFLITLFTSLTAGGSVVLAQSLGRGDNKRTCESAKQLLYAATIVAAVVTLIVLIFRGPILNMLFGDAEENVMANAMAYFSILVISFPFLAIEYAMGAIFRVQGDSMTALKISISMNLLNIVGNAIFIYGFDMGAKGAAIATLIARIAAAVVMVVIGLSKRRKIHIEKLFRYRPDWDIIKAILRIGVPNGIENSVFQLGRLLTSSLISSLGTVVIAANAATLTLANFQYNAGGAIQSTMITVVGRCVGAGEKKQAKRYAWLLLGIGYVLVIAIALILCIFAKPLLGLFKLSPDSFTLAQKLIFYHGLLSIVLWPAAFCLPSAFRAASDVRFTMIFSILSMWLFRVALAYVLAPEAVSLFGVISFPACNLSIIGVWIGMGADWLFRAVVFTVRMIRGKWLTKYGNT